MNDVDDDKDTNGHRTELPVMHFRSISNARHVTEERHRSVWWPRQFPQIAEVFEDDVDFDKEEMLTVKEKSMCVDTEHLVSRGACKIPGVMELLLGTHDPKSKLSKFRGFELILRMIATRLAELHADKWIEKDGVYAVAIGKVRFPESKNRYCNMMPIKIGDPATIPPEYEDYLPLIAAVPLARDDWAEVAYLTIDERQVEAGQSHRRAGLHVEAPTIGLKENINFFEFPEGHMPLTLRWGRGYFIHHNKKHDDEVISVRTNTGTYGHFEGGLFMASNIDDSCRVYNCKPTADAPRGKLGDLEHLRRFMPLGHTLKKNTLVWLCDLAPHESLPLPESTYRQFFRLVTRHIDVWYADHSTPNPLCELPSHVRVIHGSKFAVHEDVDIDDDDTVAPGTELYYSKPFFS
uniref:Uncharacterized protein n=1 Tax=Aureoumbra lagunensis TaxID=44058 RepID=A0A7S3JYP0_9STRA|mmetsp:Transcript_2585/g.3525  ORF Transcript_2585/g.3525 Transcript_2585/m.3525 type:complete len:406 (+) Transcript_2585:43-1260(+)